MEQTGKPLLKLVHGGRPSMGGANARQTIADVYNTAREQLIRILTLQLHSRTEAEDVAQEAYLKLAARADQLLDQNLRSLLFITARNLALDLHRQANRKRRLFDEYEEGADHVSQIPSSEPGADRWLMAREHIQIVRKLLNELPPKCSQAFIAYKFDERDYTSIADEIGVSESMVRKYVIRAMAHCVKRFAELEGWE